MSEESHGTPARTQTVPDPVCGLAPDPATPPHRPDHADTPSFFCNPRCREKFVASPEQYLAAPAPAAPPSANELAREYTCPMHPEIVRLGPGTCPICGMALEPREISRDDEANPELEDMTRRTRVSAVLTV